MIPPMGQRVSGTVVAHHPWGMDLSLHGEWEGLIGTVDIIYLSDEGRFDSAEDFPPVGTRMEAVTLVVMASGQLRLSTRHSDLIRLRE